MSFKPEDLETIEKALTSPDLRVRFGEREVWSKPNDDLERAFKLMKKDLTSKKNQFGRRVVSAFFKGLD